MVYLAQYDDNQQLAGFLREDGAFLPKDREANINAIATNTVTYKTQSELDGLALEAKRTQKISEINNSAKVSITGGFTSLALDGTTVYHYQSDLEDQLNLIGLVSSGADDYFTCSVDDGLGNPTTLVATLHTIAQLQQVLTDGKAVKQASLVKARDLKTQASVAVNIAEIDAIVW